ncbi:AarF/ABC1/UbiB kinase family protein [Candidatus Woesearchaeota archaeon]|nr:AarF/ABC1/UbiB kinase family protein [Candidatus Woesearchaeota archaeon]
MKSHLRNTFRDAERIREVVLVLVNEGLGYFVDKMKLRWHLPLHKNIQLYQFTQKDYIPLEVRLRRSMEKLGGAYIKLGQLLSIRPDLVPLAYCKEFSKLQDQVPSFPFSEAKQSVEKELGKPLKEVFSSFEEKPLGSASVGQVHRATLHEGTQVVVKVQRPHIQEIFAEDIDILYYLFGKLDKYYHYENFSPLIILQEFERYTKKELDYRFERRNLELFGLAFQHAPLIKIPRVYSSLSTTSILVMEHVEGKKLSDLLASKTVFPRKQIAQQLVETALQQVFASDVFHADLHPGNILILPKGKIALLDFGIVGSLDAELRSKGIDLFLALLEKDVQGVVNALVRMGEVHEDTDLEALKRDAHDILMRWYGTTLSEVRVTSMLHHLFDACLARHVSLPVDMILLGKALVTVEATCAQLDPDFDFVSIAKPYLTQFLKQKIKKSVQPQHLLKEALQLKDTLKAVPREMLSVLDTIQKGKLNVAVAKEEVTHLTQEMDRSSNRLAFSMIIASLIVGGALLMQTDIEPYLWGMPLFALLCFSGASIISLFLILSIFKEGRWSKLR